MMSYLTIMLLCLAIAVKLCVVLTHEDYICAENPDCFSLLIKHHQTLSDTIAKQLSVQDKQLHIQQEQLSLLREFKAHTQSSASLSTHIYTALLSNVINLIVMGIAVAAFPWMYRKLIAYRKLREQNRIERELAQAVIQSVVQNAHGSGHANSDRRNITVSTSLVEKMDEAVVLNFSDYGSSQMTSMNDGVIAGSSVQEESV